VLKLILTILFAAGWLLIMVGSAFVWAFWPTLTISFALMAPLITVAFIQAANPTETDHS
jgi:hypothetical protein